jgi:hypothetical protein
MFILSGGAAILVKYGGHSLELWEKGLVLSVLSGLWLVVAVYFLGDISAHCCTGVPRSRKRRCRLRAGPSHP